MTSWLQHGGIRLGLAALCVFGVAGFLLLAPLLGELRKAASDDPKVWEEDIAAFERADRESPPPQRPIVFAGSSSIRLWDDLESDMAPLPVIGRGFGGAKTPDLIHYSDRIISAYDPRAVVLYIGSNDMSRFPFAAPPATPTQVAGRLSELAKAIHARSPAVPLYFVALKPTRVGAEDEDVAQVNAAIEALAASDPRIHAIDANAGLRDAEGRADRRYLLFDGLHLNRAGYAVWGPPIRERLTRDFPNARSGG